MKINRDKFSASVLLLIAALFVGNWAWSAADLGNTAVISPTDASNGSGTCPSWLGSAAPSTLDDAGRCLQGAIAREWENRSFAVTSTGSANAYVVAYTVAPAAYRSGQVYSFITNFTVSGSATVNINSLGAKTIKKDVAGTLTALSSGDMASGQFVMLAYNGTDMIWVNWQGSAASAATDTSAGIVELATNAETVTGTDTARATTPAGVAAAIAAATTVAYPPGHIFGLGMSNAADTVNDITISTGSTRSEGDTGNITLAASITKQIDAAWSVGTNAGGMNTGSVANDTWYEVHLIKRADTGVVDMMFTTTANRATLPTNYTLQRRIGWVRRGTATNLQFTQVDDYFTLTTQINDGSAISATTTAAQLTLTVPPSSRARFRATLAGGTNSTTSETVVLSEVAEGNVTPAVTTAISSLTVGDSDATAGVMSKSAGQFELMANSSSQIEYDWSSAGANTSTLNVSTFGWVDQRGRLSQ